MAYHPRHRPERHKYAVMAPDEWKTIVTEQRIDLNRLLAMPKGQSRRWLWPAVGGGALVVMLGLWWGLSGSSSTVTYETVAAESGDLVVTVTATGTVQPTTEVEVSSELSGTLAKVNVDYNDTVTVGQVLAELDTTKLAAQVTNAEAQLASAKGQLAQAKATATEAETNYKSDLELDRRGITAKTDLTASEATFARAKAAVDVANANLSLAEANLSSARADLAKAQITSPINGIVLDRAAEAGQIVASSLEAPVLFTLAEDLAHMELQVDIDEADIGRVSVGNSATFSVDAYSDRSFPATITQVRYAPEDTDGVVTYKAVLSVDNPDGLLRPGMTATSTITVAKVTDALMVDNAALRYSPPQTETTSSSRGSGLLGLIMPRRPSSSGGAATDGQSVWVLRNGVPEQVAVTPGESDGTRTAVTSDGLAAGDAVITDQSESN